MYVSDVAVTITPGWPLNVTLVNPVKWSPAIWTVVPTSPELGEKPEIYGPGPTTVNESTLLLVPFIVLTVIGPLVAPSGTRVEIWVPSELTENWVAIPPKLTLMVLAKC